MDDSYADRWISCTPAGIVVRGYYFPWGSKHIRYDQIRSYRRVELSALRGNARIWGTSNPKYWASLDPGRPGKREALILDLGKPVQPLLTPDDPNAVESDIQRHTSLGAARRDGPGPLI